MTQKRGKEFEEAVKQLLEAYNLDWLRVDTYRCPNCEQIINRNAAGFPDYQIISPFILYVECKTGSSRLNSNQREVRQKLEAQGQDYFVARDNIDGLKKLLDKKLNKN